MVKEIKCKCNQCGKIWHYLPSEESSIKTQQVGNAMVGVGMCCSPLGPLYSNKSLDLARQANKFKKCPECGSSDITKKTIEYERKE